MTNFAAARDPSSRSVRFEETINEQSKAALERYLSCSRFYALFHMGYALVALLELLSLLIFFSFLAKSTLFALALASVFLTGFSYCVLLFYFQAKKPEQFEQICKDFLDGCRSSLPSPQDQAHLHFSLAQSTYKLLDLLEHQEYTYYSSPLTSLKPLLEKFSAWVHWKDVLNMKQLLHKSAIENYIALIRIDPLNLKAHAALASAHLSCARIYRSPELLYPERPITWTSPEYSSKPLRAQFEYHLHRAQEELRILDEYAPNDSWVHKQLAAIYHDLNMPEKELAAYELSLQLEPHNQDLLLRIGTLYFALGHNAKGLKIYNQLQQANSSHAPQLISHYG